MVTDNKPNGASEGSNLWRVTADTAADLSLNQGATDVDVLIIGGGFTGLRAAIGLADSGHSVALVEAGDLGWGASGRSGGQVNPIMRLQSRKLASLIGEAAADRLIRATIGSANEVFQLIARHGMACDATQRGWAQVAHCDSAAESLRGLAEDWRRFGANIQELDKEETWEATGSTVYEFSLLHPFAGHLHPLKYVHGLARTAVSKGAAIYTHAPAQDLRPRNGRWEITANNQAFIADKVLICTNAYQSGLNDTLDKSYIPVTPVQLATEVLDDDVYEAVLPEERTIADTRRMIFYARKTADRRLVFGGLGTRIDGQADYDRIAREATRVFPQLLSVKWEYSWGGHIAMTTDSLPHVHEVAQGVYAALGCNGRGVAMGTVVGRVLSEIINEPGTEKDVPVIPLKKIPFQPLLKKIIPAGMPLLRVMDRMDR